MSVFVDSARQFQSFFYVKLTNRIIYTRSKQYLRYSAPRQGSVQANYTKVHPPGCLARRIVLREANLKALAQRHKQRDQRDQLAPTRTDPVKLCFSLIQFSEKSNHSIFQTQLESFWPRLVAKTRAGNNDVIVYFCIRMHMFKLILP